MMAVLVPVLAAVVAGVASYLVARIGHRTARESQGVQALSDSVTAMQVVLTETRKSHDEQMRSMQAQLDRQRTDLTAVANEKNDLTKRVGRLERALDAARRYVAVLINTLSAHSITPPDPPADYTH